MTERRVGMWTLGLSLIGFGVLFFLHSGFGLIDFVMVWRLWPLVFIFLGIETVIFAVQAQKVKVRIDILSVITIFLLLGFAGALAVLEMAAKYYCL